MRRVLWLAALMPFASMTAMATPRGDAASVVVDVAREVAGNSTGVEVETLHTEMGSFRETFRVGTFPRKGVSASFLVPFPAGTRSLFLEIQEIHHRRPDAYGYTVLVNGRDVYFRTYQELGAGPNHYFIEVPADLLESGAPLEVSLRHEGGGPFSIGRVWAHDDFFAKVEPAEKVARPMAILFPTSSIRLEGETEETRRKEPEAEFERFRKMKELYSGFVDYGPVGVLAFAGGYGHVDPAEGRKSLFGKVDLSSRAGMPGLWLINGTGWGGKPTGPDGLGGWFSDIQYTYTAYEPASSVWRASWPNMWANTPGAALRDPVMNRLLGIRFGQMVDGLQKELALRRLEGKPSETMIIREFAPASGEISQAVVEAAAQDGVILDPVDGLDATERLWLHRDAVNTWQELADGTVGALGRDIVVVDQGDLQLPGEQLVDNLYAHPDFLTNRPMNDPRWGGGQHGMVDGLWSSGEMGEGKNFRDIAMYDYLRARGKLSMINMERTILKEDFSVMKRHYERGFQFLCFFNADPGDEKLVKAVDGISGDPVDPPVHRQPVLLDIVAEREEVLGEKVVSSENMKVHSGLRLAVEDVARPGEVLYRIANSGDAFPAGFALELDGRISPGEENRIEVFLGSSPDEMEKVATLTEADLPDPEHWTPYMTTRTEIPLGDSMVGKTEAFLKLVFHARHAPDAAFLLGFGVQSQWPLASGHRRPTTMTKGQLRALQLWVQERAIAQRLLKKYDATGGEGDETSREATRLIAEGWYRSAAHLLSGAISELTPATYLVRGHGRLGRHPIEVRFQSPDAAAFLTLESDGSGGWLVSLEPIGEPVDCELALLNTPPEWKSEPAGENCWRLLAGSPGGSDRFTLQAVQKTSPAPVYPSKMVGRCLQANADSLQIEIQDLEVMDHASSLTLPIARNARMIRRAARETDPEEEAKGNSPQPFDRVEVQLDSSGQVARIDALYGFTRGAVKAFHPPAVVGRPSNGEIELEDGSRYGLAFDRKATQFDTVAMQGQILAYELRHLPLAMKPGDRVDLRFTPSLDAGGLPRLVSVKQPRRLLLDVDYTGDVDGAWKKAVYSVEGADVRPHKPEPNYLYRVVMPLLRPTEAFLPGSVTYRIESEGPLGTTVAEIAARAFDDSSRVTVFASADGRAWTKCGQFDNTWQNNISQTLDNIPYQFIDLTPVVQGLRSFYLKLELAANSADHRFCVAKLRVATEDTP
jgi:hypothetical protein